MKQISNFYNYAKIFEYTMGDSKILEELRFLSNFIENKKKEQRIEIKFFLDNVNIDLLNNLFINLKKNTKIIIGFLHKKKQLYYFDFFYKYYFLLYKKKYNIKNMTVYSVVHLAEEEINNLLKHFRKIYNSDFIISNILDENLLMGIKIKIEDKCYDDSLNTKLKKII